MAYPEDDKCKECGKKEDRSQLESSEGLCALCSSGLKADERYHINS